MIFVEYLLSSALTVKLPDFIKKPQLSRNKEILYNLQSIDFYCYMDITLHPIATVTNKRDTPTDDFWGDTISEITLLPHIPEEAFKGVEDFSHLEIIYFFDKADDNKIVFSGRPRATEHVKMGIFCQRKRRKANHLGLCTVELVEHKGKTIKSEIS